MIIHAQERVNYYPNLFIHVRFTINGLNRQDRIQKCSNENDRHFLNPFKTVSIKRVKFLRSSEVSLYNTDIKTTNVYKTGTFSRTVFHVYTRAYIYMYNIIAMSIVKSQSLYITAVHKTIYYFSHVHSSKQQC